MSKRFTATEKWEDPWFRKLSSKNRSAWLFLLDKCDNAGVWVVDIDIMNFFTGEDFDSNELLLVLKGRVERLNNGSKWFVIRFIEYQYGTLSENCKPHQHIIGLLKKHSLYERYSKGFNTLEEKDKEQDKEKDKDKDIIRGSKFKQPSVDDVHKYCVERKNGIDAEAFVDYYQTRGWMVGKNKMKDWKAAVRTWERNSFDTPEKDDGIPNEWKTPVKTGGFR